MIAVLPTQYYIYLSTNYFKKIQAMQIPKLTSLQSFIIIAWAIAKISQFELNVWFIFICQTMDWAITFPFMIIMKKLFLELFV